MVNGVKKAIKTFRGNLKIKTMAYKMKGMMFKSPLPQDDEKMMTASGKVVDKKTAKNFGKDMMQDKVADDAAKIAKSKKSGQGTKVGQYTGAGIPENLYNADGKKINTNNLDEGNLSKIKLESGTERKYVEYIEGPKEGGRLYFSNPK